MKYMLLIYDNPDTREIFSGERGAELNATMNTIMDEITKSGELVGTQALADPSTAKSVRAGEGSPAVTDGPFAEAKEFLGGYLILDCDLERAVEVAGRWPVVGTGGIEVRAVMDGSGEEM
ncbi:MAG TPA: YciI family protein [Solirubrobacterales bacterium]|nr:YciI family protein [Solirubrobacterales bacterium]